MLYGMPCETNRFACETIGFAFAVFFASSRRKTQCGEVDGGFRARAV